MNLVNLALTLERFVQGQPPVTLAAMQCVRTLDKASECDLCARACPVGAIRLEGGVQIDADACIRCGLCLHTCPTGAISGTDNTPRLIYCASQLTDRDVVEIACAHHPEPATGDPAADAVLTVIGCLATLGVSAYLGLAAHKIRRVQVRLDSCAQCPLAVLQPAIERTIQGASHWLTALDHRSVVGACAPTPRPKRRPVYSIKNPPVSRRGFFQAIGQGARDFLPPLEDASERRRLITTLRQLAPTNSDRPVTGEGFTNLSVSDACTGCTTCARSCPTGALEFLRNEEAFQIRFLASECINCGLCIEHCEPKALQRSGPPTLTELIDPEPVILHSGALSRCRRCNTRFAGKPDGGLCPICAVRRDHPFGMRGRIGSPPP
ncbi:MAG: 4Fe-4S binding protein [Chloroflexi bacterium]|nr:4Fe-4S binding protein [Chloroflexota bacterium]